MEYNNMKGSRRSRGGRRRQKDRSQDEVETSTASTSIKKENVSKSKVASRGRKHKAATGGSGTVCEKCGEEFETRNKLHQHLGETGHATLRTR